MKKDFVILLDTVKDPRDLAEITHLAIATDQELIITGKSIKHDHPKVVGIIDSWKPRFKEKPKLKNVKYFDNYFSTIEKLKKQGYEIIGTTPNSGKSLYQTNLSKGKQIIVFGTETGGLSKQKKAVLDYLITVPMKNQTRFYTLKTIVPIVVHEILRQKGFFRKPKKQN